MIPVEQNELEQNFDHYFDRVINGESFLITVNGENSVVMIPYHDYEILIKQASSLPETP